MAEDLDLTKVEQIIGEVGEEEGGLIPVLQKAQDVFGYLPREVLQSIADRLGVSLTKVYGVATFYSQFHLTPRGRHIIQQCDGTACHVRGAARIIETVERELGIKAGETSSALTLWTNAVRPARASRWSTLVAPTPAPPRRTFPVTWRW